MKPRSLRRRAAVIGVVLLPAYALLIGRLWELQIGDGERYQAMAREQHLRDIQVPARRGPILDRNGHTLADSVLTESVYAHPAQIEDAPAAARALAPLVGQTVAQLQKTLTSGRMFTWLARRVPPETGAAVRAANLAGVGTAPEFRRYYPSHTLAANVLGFVGTDGEGLEGLERRFDGDLRGRAITVDGIRDARGRNVLTGDLLAAEATRGAALKLTLDATVQHIAEEELARALAATSARAATAVVLEVASGDILAMATLPTFDPNSFSESPKDAFRNRAVTDVYEPGSTMKIVMMAAALQHGVVGPTTLVDCEGGRYQIGTHTIHDGKNNGWISATDVLRVSSNVGAAKIAQNLGREALHQTLRNFGFGSRVSGDFPGESAGFLTAPEKWSQLQLCTTAFGHGIGVTTLQLAAATAVIAAGGVFRAPRIIDEVEPAEHGAVPVPRPPAAGRRVITTEVATQLTDMMVAVIESGTGQRAAIPGMQLAGKTGTAHKVDPVSGGYLHDRYIADFVGFAPANDPELVVVVMLDEPTGAIHSGGEVAAPVFREIVQRALVSRGHAAPVADARPARARTAESEPSQPVLTSRTTEPAPAHPTAGGLPDLRGLSVREALERVHRAGLRADVRVTGTGLVRAQSPEPGTAAAGVITLSLVLGDRGQGDAARVSGAAEDPPKSASARKSPPGTVVALESPPVGAKR